MTASLHKRVTLRDVAVLARTTPMTVSNVINGRPGQVSPEVAERVLAACAELDYRPHASARQLRTSRRQAIGVLIVDPSPYYVSDPLTAALLAGLNACLGQQSYSILLHGVPPDALGNVMLLRQIESDGICLLLSGAPAHRLAMLERVAALRQPIVLIQEALPDDIADGASVRQDDETAGRAVGAHLFDRPVAHAVMLVPALEWPAMVEREAGVRATLRDCGAFHVVPCEDEGFAASQAALARHVGRHGLPDVLIGGNDQMAIAGMRLLIERGLRVPADLRVAGFNGLEFWRYATPELTTVFSPAYALGEAAGRAMLTRLETGSFPTRQQVLPVRFAAHGSSILQGE